MKRLLGILPAVIVSSLLTVGNLTGFRLPVMRPLSLVCFTLTMLTLIAKRKRAGLSAIDKALLLFVMFSIAAFWGFPQSLLPLAADFSVIILYATLCAVAVLPALFKGEYFTVYFARQRTPEAFWGTDIFKTINRHLTWFWATLFALAALLAAMPVLFGLQAHSPAGMFWQVLLPAGLMLGLGIPLNYKYPQYYLRKTGLEPPTMAAAGSIRVPGRQQEEIMTHQLKVVAINGSPHGVIGNTGQLLAMVAAALAAEDIILEEITVSDKRIEYCVGCAVCLEQSRCWRTDDHAAIVDRLLAADGIILASPVYFDHVTAQLKTFIDRSLCFGHKPRTTWKPGLAVCVSAGKGESDTGRYLARTLHAYGAFSVGTLTAIATKPGGFLGKAVIEARARDLAGDLSRAIKEKRQYPASDEDLSYYLFMRDLVTREKEFMQDDYRYWRETGLIDGFEGYMQQGYAGSDPDAGTRKEWIRGLIREDRARGNAAGNNQEQARSTGIETGTDSSPGSAASCLELIRMMPAGFRSEAARSLTAVYQFEISGPEEFTVHLKIEDGRCSFHEGRHGRPDVTITSPSDVWLAIARKEMNGQTAYMTGKYKASGDIGLLLKLKELFGNGPQEV